MVAIGVLSLELGGGGSIGAGREIGGELPSGRGLKSSEQGGPKREEVVLNRFDATALTRLCCR